MSKIIKKHISTITKTPVHWRTSRNKVAFIPQAYSHYLSPLQKGESLYSFISRNSANCTSPASLHHQWWHNPFRLPSLFAEGIKCTQQLKFASIPQKEKKYEYNEKDSRSNDMIRASKDALFLSLSLSKNTWWQEWSEAWASFCRLKRIEEPAGGATCSVSGQKQGWSGRGQVAPCHTRRGNKANGHEMNEWMNVCMYCKFVCMYVYIVKCT